jgi:alkyl hydroperoxide reductase subunit AhpF
MSEQAGQNPLSAETWATLPDFLEKIPNRVQLRVWGDPRASTGEREAARLARGLADGFEQIEMSLLPRQENYPFYPVWGVFGDNGDGDYVDQGIRLIGLPAGVQLTSLIAAIQAVSFKGTTLEPKTRIRLSRLQTYIRLEVLTAADDEVGTVLAKTAFGFAASSARVSSYVIMADVFPEVMWRYSARKLPHLVINGRFHSDGFLSEEDLLQAVAKAAG